MENTKPMLVEVKDLKTHFFMNQGLIRAVDGVDFHVGYGETLGLVGESGCGKSITSRSILRLIQPPGRIVDGKINLYIRSRDNPQVQEIVDVTALDPNGNKMRSIRGGEIAMVFQEPMTSLSPVHTVGNQIMEAIWLHRDVNQDEARKMTIEMLSRVRMSQPTRVIDQYPFQLSGGMRQRVMIAMALVCRPRLLIADEPTTALDVTTEAQILNLMRSLQREMGMAIIFITHNLGVIAQMAERVAVMYLGQIVETANVKDLFGNPQHPYTQALLRSIPRLGKKSGEPLESIRGTVPDPFSTPKGCRFHARCNFFIPGVCNVIDPPNVMLKPGHEVRCHLYGEHKPA
jgi:peptide/nickel transport system ATP-binding protein